MNKELLIMNHFTKTISVLLVGSALSACCTITSPKPDEMVRQGIQRSLLQDNQFDLTGKIQLKLTPSADEKLPEIDKKKAEIEQLSAEIQQMSASPSSPKTSHKKAGKKTARPKRVNHTAEKKALLEATQAEHEALINLYENQKLADIFSERITITFSGAVDLPHGQIELIPALHYDSQNAYGVTQLPVHLDMQNMNLIVDSHGISEFKDVKVRITNPERVQGDKNQALHITGKDNEIAEARQLIATIPKALDAGFAALDKNSFVFLPMDEAGQKAGARYRIGVRMTAEENKRFYKAVLGNMDELLAQFKLQNQEGDSSQVGQILQEWAQLLSDEEDETKTADKAETDTNQKHEEQQIEEKAALPEINVNYYFSRQGRLVAIRKIIDASTLLHIWDSDSNRAGKLIIWTQLHYTQHPKFTVKSNPDDLVILGSKEVDGMLFQ